MSDPKTKQITTWVSVDVWKTIRLEAARRKVAMTTLLLDWIQPELNKLKDQPLDESEE